MKQTIMDLKLFYETDEQRVISEFKMSSALEKRVVIGVLKEFVEQFEEMYRDE